MILLGYHKYSDDVTNKNTALFAADISGRRCDTHLAGRNSPLKSTE